MDPASVAAIAVIVVATAYAVVRKALFSLTYAVAVLGVYVLEAASSVSGIVVTSPVVFELGLTAGPGLLPLPWTWITFEFIHASEAHVFLNLLGLVFIAPTFEERVGSARWAVLFFAGGAVGALVFLAVHLGQAVLLVGASAGISAVFGAYGRLYPNDRVTLFLPIPGVPAIRVAELVVGFLVLEILLGLIGPGASRGRPTPAQSLSDSLLPRRPCDSRFPRARGARRDRPVSIGSETSPSRRSCAGSWINGSRQTSRRPERRGWRSSSRTRDAHGAEALCDVASGGSRVRADGDGPSEPRSGPERQSNDRS